jgi:CheY-like chemotaxis protein
MTAERERALVLVADDDDDIRDLVAMHLRQAGYEVIAAADGDTGLELIRARRPDLVVLDVKMPGLGGYELTRRLKADPSTAEIPILLLSASVRQEEVQEGISAGADEFMAKPFPATKFRERVAALLS